MPPVVQRGEGGSVGAGLSTTPRRLIPAVLGLPSNTGHLDPSVLQYQVPGFAPSGDRRRFSGVEPLGAQHPPIHILNQHAHGDQPTPSAYPSYPWSSSPPAIPTAQYQAAVPADMVLGPLTHRESVVSLHSEESFQLSSSSSLQGDLGSNATFSPRYASPDAHFAGDTLPQLGTSLAAPEPLRKTRRTGKRKRVADPKDPRAAKRLQDQRQSDDEHIEDLYELLVPDSEGEVSKKDRLGLSTSQSFCLSS